MLLKYTIRLLLLRALFFSKAVVRFMQVDRLSVRTRSITSLSSFSSLARRW